jgi:cell division control protein 6
VNLFKRISSEAKLFKNEAALAPDYLPEEILHRERELREIAFALKSLEELRRQPSVLVYGPPGTGKTCTAKYVAKEFTEYTQRAFPVYINCWQTNTRYAILAKIAQSMDAFVPSTGITVDDMLSRMKEAFQDGKKVPLVILDEFDVLHHKGEDAILYDLLRLQEVYGISIGLILITNDVEFVATLDRRIRSSLAQNAIEFPSYAPQELKDILKERAKLALYPGSYNDEVISVCSGFAAKNHGDARIGISLLWMTAKEAEKKDHETLMLEDVEAAKKKLGVSVSEVKTAKAESAGTLKDEEKSLLELIRNAKGGEITSGELYSKVKLNERTARNYLSHLEELGLVGSEEKALKAGRTRVFRITEK